MFEKQSSKKIYLFLKLDCNISLLYSDNKVTLTQVQKDILNINKS